MYKFYLGAFGNRSYIRPQFEIDNGKLRIIEEENRRIEFPNGGTVSLNGLTENDTDNIKNRLLKFKIDFANNRHPNFDPTGQNSNKYQIPIANIEELDRDQIIEIIEIDCTIKEFLNEKSRRTIRIDHKPNKLILLKYAQECYGPFEFMISDIEDSYADETYYTLKISVNSGTINMYKYSDLEKICYDATYSIRRSDRMQFIYNKDRLNAIAPSEKIDYFDNEELADYFKTLLDNTDGIDNLIQLKEQFFKIADSFSDGSELSDKKLQRICDILRTASDLKDYKFRLIEQYFKANPNAKKDKEDYLKNHEELLDGLAREDIRYEEKRVSLDSELEKLRNEMEEISEKIKEGKKNLHAQQSVLEKLGEQAVSQKKQEIEESILAKQAELVSIKEELEKMKNETKQQQTARDFWKEQRDTLKEECEAITKDINKKVIEWAADDRNAEIRRLLVSQFEVPDVNDNISPLQGIRNLKDDLGAEQIANIIYDKLKQAGRDIKPDEAYNYLICLTNNYITVFAGEPGTGKTSLCKILAKALGIYDNRYAEILVERGWTSPKDLIGYYNPLTREIEKTQPRFSDCMQQLDKENKNNMVEAPYFVLLDEANLSPIEFYWSDFNHFSDEPSHQYILYSNGEKYEFGSELKFLATINYDQTTTDLSPRFLDRAWVVSMNAVSFDTVASSLIDDSDIANNDEVISLASLKRLFDWRNVKDKKLNQVTKNCIDEIIAKMKEGNHIISARSQKAVMHYCLVAEMYMPKEVALDYAISQKILPCISGNGKKYKEFLNSLMAFCKENQLNKCAGIISKIIERSEHEFYGFFSL